MQFKTSISRLPTGTNLMYVRLKWWRTQAENCTSMDSLPR